MTDLSVLEEIKADITLITSTSYMECDQIPLFDLVAFHNMVVEKYNKMNDTKGGAAHG